MDLHYYQVVEVVAKSQTILVFIIGPNVDQSNVAISLDAFVGYFNNSSQNIHHKLKQIGFACAPNFAHGLSEC